MQALRKRTAQAINQVKRRQKKHNTRESKTLRSIRIYRTTQRNKVQHHNWKLCQQEVREKWLLGEVRSRPGYLEEQKSDVPQEWKPSTYERRQEHRAEREKELSKRNREAVLLEREEKRRHPEYSVAKGDRVVISAIDGPCARYRGNVGTVVGVNRQKKVCVVEGMTIRQARAPKSAPLYTLFTEPHLDPEHPVLLPIPFTHLRLIKTVINGSGAKEDVVIGRLTPQDLVHMGRPIEAEELYEAELEKERNSPAFLARKAAEDKRNADAKAAEEEPESEDTKLAREQANPDSPIHNKKKKKEPGPITKLFNRVTGRKPATEEDDKKHNDDGMEVEAMIQSRDTSRLDRDRLTWTPTLLRAPLPAPIIDELRGKYSKFRSRHDAEFVQKMQRADSMRENYRRWARSGAGVLATPRREAWLREQARRKELRRGVGGKLDERILEGIGRVMWERGMRLDEKGEIEARVMGEKAGRRRVGQGKVENPVADVVAAKGLEEGDRPVEEVR